MDKRLKETIAAFRVPPKMVHNDRGETVEVILSYDEYKAFLRFLANYVDWELLPPYLQDAVDSMLADDARAEQGDEPPTPLDEVLAEFGIKLGDQANTEE
jgi:hypothetical protein